MKRILSRWILAAAALCCLAACNPKTYKNINYFQNVAQDTTMTLESARGIVIQPKDMISIVVSCSKPELAAMFNLPVVSYQAGSESAATMASSMRLMAYSVSNEGTIDFPVFGALMVAGLNRWEVSELIKKKLVSSGMISDPIVTVEFLNFKIGVLGEVVRPGSFTINGDRINLLQAISLAGDLTIYGRRDNVMVVREQNGKRLIYHLDLRDTERLFASPGFDLQQNDLVYVTPNHVRAGQSTINENYFKSAGFWMSLGSMALTVANFIILLSR